MERKNEMLYTTGEFAKFFSIKKDTLFYYDKIGFFSPARVADNGYRYYTASQIPLFGAMLSMREMNVPISEIRDYFEKQSPEELTVFVRNQLERIDKEIEKLRKIRINFTMLKAAMEEIRSASLDLPVIEYVEDKYFIYGDKNVDDNETSDEQWWNIYGEFMTKYEFFGLANIGSVISRENINAGRFQRVDRLFIPAEKGKGQLRAGGEYITIYYKGEYSGIGRAYRAITDFAAKRDYVITGDAYEEYLVTEIAVADKRDFITKISVAVKKSSQAKGEDI